MTRPVIGVASLRCGDPNVIRSIAAGGGPVYVNDDLHLACALCACGMSFDAYEPNPLDEWCADTDCWCHDPELPA